MSHIRLTYEKSVFSALKYLYVLFKAKCFLFRHYLTVLERVRLTAIKVLVSVRGTGPIYLYCFLLSSTMVRLCNNFLMKYACLLRKMFLAKILVLILQLSILPGEINSVCS